jgi:deazaflavin-dependent oxidoreductase (nitroreductase family)
MPIPLAVGKWNRAGLNHVTRLVAPWAPGMGLIVHRGRRSGRRYETPVQVFPVDGGFVIALTYGPRADWIRNVLAAGGCELRTRGRSIQLTEPRLYQDETRQHIYAPERQLLRLLKVTDFLALKTAGPGAD